MEVYLNLKSFIAKSNLDKIIEFEYDWFKSNRYY